MSETSFRQKLGVYLRASGWHVTQIESHATAAGVPDTNAHKEGVERWFELKEGAKPKLRRTQLVWARERARAGGTTFVIWRNHKSYWALRIAGSTPDLPGYMNMDTLTGFVRFMTEHSTYVLTMNELEGIIS